MTELIAALYGVIKAIPIIDGWVRQFIDFYINAQVEKIEVNKIEKQEKIAVIMAQIQKVGTNAEKAALLAALTDIKRV